MKNIIVVRKRIYSRLYDTELGKGAQIHLNQASRAMINFLQILQKEDNTFLSGDIEHLKSIDSRYQY